MTDGFNDTGHGPDLASTVTMLHSLADPRRPLPLFTIGIGPAADMNALRQLAAATGGRAYQVSTATDIVNVFLDVLAQRVCAPRAAAQSHRLSRVLDMGGLPLLLPCQRFPPSDLLTPHRDVAMLSINL